MSYMDYLFVYGTLAPGRKNAHVLADIKGTWSEASINGKLYPEGWGAAEGFPGIVLGENDETVNGLVFASDQLDEHWTRLDEFEGEGYRRELSEIYLTNNDIIEAYVYVLNR